PSRAARGEGARSRGGLRSRGARGRTTGLPARLRGADHLPDLARLRDPVADDALVHHLAALDVTDDALRVDEERDRQTDDAVAARGLAVEVEERVEAVERELVEERARPRAVLLEIDSKEDRVAAARDAVQRRHLRAARRAP